MAVLGVMLIWSARALVDYGGMLATLAGKPLVERGRIGSNEWQSFLERAGRPHLHAQSAEALGRGDAGQPSRVANSWASIVQIDSTLPHDARVYLQVPNLVLYYYATTIWYPRRVDVTTHADAVIRDAETLQQQCSPVDESRYNELRELGYTDVLTPEGFVHISGDAESGRQP